MKTRASRRHGKRGKRKPLRGSSKAVINDRTPKGASGSGWSFSSYSGTAPYSTTLPAFAANAVGYSSIGVSGTDQQSGSNNTSYSFQTAASFNGIDWSEMGQKTSSGSGGTSDTFSAQSGNLTFPTAPFSTAAVSGSASISGTLGTSYG